MGVRCLRGLSSCGVLAAAAALLACASEDAGPPVRCAEPSAAVTPEVSGVFDYASAISPVYGTITFEQSESEVRITDTTYANADDRPLEGVGALDGNRLQVVLTPKNGDADYEARVDLVFAEDGQSFCLLGFSDTNGDEGGAGSHWGTKR
jgi:hypothetical protein